MRMQLPQLLSWFKPLGASPPGGAFRKVFRISAARGDDGTPRFFSRRSKSWSISVSRRWRLKMSGRGPTAMAWKTCMMSCHRLSCEKVVWFVCDARTCFFGKMHRNLWISEICGTNLSVLQHDVLKGLGTANTIIPPRLLWVLEWW